MGASSAVTRWIGASSHSKAFSLTRIAISPAIPPVRVRYDECIGCEICVRVCEKLAWDAIVMRPTEEVERTAGVTIHERFPAVTA